MFDHVELPVRDLSRSVDFYRTVLAPLGIELTHAGETTAEFGALTLARREPRDRLHLAFIAESREAVEAFHRVGVEAGYRDNGAPGLRDYALDYFAAYLLDPDGHNIEAVHRSPETRAGWSWLAIGAVSQGQSLRTGDPSATRPGHVDQPLSQESFGFGRKLQRAFLRREASL